MMNLSRASKTLLTQALGQLDRYEAYVFWIRDREMTRQIYQGKNFAKIWQREPELVNKYPLIWLDFLEDSRKNFYMEQLQNRHNADYNDQTLNLIFYQIKLPDNSIKYIVDNCFKCVDAENKLYIAGMAKSISKERWTAIEQYFSIIHAEFDKKIESHYLSLLKSNFLLVPFKKIVTSDIHLTVFQEKILVENINLSQREIECLFYLCLGNTAKEIGKIIYLSSRTVETHLEQIRIKANAKNGFDIVSRFSKYLSN